GAPIATSRIAPARVPLERSSLNAVWTLRLYTGMRAKERPPFPPRGGGLLDRNLDQRAVLHHGVDVLPIPVSSDALKHLTALLWIGDFPSRRRQVGPDSSLQMHRHLRIGIEVGQPAASPARRLAADIEPAI